MSAPTTWEEAWKIILERWLPDDPLRPDESFAGQYRLKFDAARGAKPALIAEIGVRAGYSALAMLLGAPTARFIGIEQDAGNFGGIQGITARAVPTVLAGFNTEIRYEDSANLSRLDEIVDLFHVDGDHSYDGTMRDLELAWSCSRFIMVDDYEFIRSTQAAVDHFIVTHRLVYPFCQALGDGGFRGSMMLAGAFHPKLVGRRGP
jgi:hypothetical protein